VEETVIEGLFAPQWLSKWIIIAEKRGMYLHPPISIGENL
jgi:hypothetical protein